MPDHCGTNIKSRLLAVSVFVVGGRFHLHIRFIEEMNGLLGVASQVTLVHFVRFVNFLDRFLKYAAGLQQALANRDSQKPQSASRLPASFPSLGTALGK